MSVGTNPTAPHHSPLAGMGPAIAGDPVAANKQESSRPSRGNNLGGLAGLAELKEASRRAAPTHGTGKARSDPRELLSLDRATQLAILKEIRNGTKVDPARKRLHDMVIAHLDKQLAKTKQIAPGVWATGFSHVRELDSDSAVTEDGWADQDLGDAKNDILDETIAYMSKPNGPPPPRVFTFEQAAYGKPPTQDPSLMPDGPIYGRNGYGDPTMVMCYGKHLRDLMSDIKHSHDKTMDVGSDGLAPHRAAWIVALHQIDLTRLINILGDLSDGSNDDVIKPMIDLAKKIKQDGVEKFIESMQIAADGTGKPNVRMTYPAGSEHVERDSEKDLRDLSIALLGDMKTPDGRRLLDAEDTDATLFVTALLNRLEVNSAVVEKNQSGNGPSETLSIGKEGADAINAYIEGHPSTKANALFAEYVHKVPIVVISDKGICVQMPKPAQASEDANAPEADEAGDTSEKSTAEKKQSAHGPEKTPDAQKPPETPSGSGAAPTHPDASAGDQPGPDAAAGGVAAGGVAAGGVAADGVAAGGTTVGGTAGSGAAAGGDGSNAAAAAAATTAETDNAAGAGANPTEAPPPTTPNPATNTPPASTAPWMTPKFQHG